MRCAALTSARSLEKLREVMPTRHLWVFASFVTGCSNHILGTDWQCEEQRDACAELAGCTRPRCDEGTGSGGSRGHDAGQPTFILGADISWTLEDERAGARYFDQGSPGDLVQILREHGFNYVRLRTFVNPAAPGGYAEGATEAWNDLQHTIEMAQRVYQNEMGFLLNFHYSDTWADPGHQIKPQAWQALPFESLTERVYEYTRSSLSALASAGVPPHLVQIGNEITAGMLHPDGISYPDENWPRLSALLEAGIAAVRDTDPRIRIMLQIEKCNDNAASRWWLDNAISQGIEFEILAQSCYTAYHGTPAQWRANFDDLARRYPALTFAVGEYSHEKRAANDLLFALPERRGLGSFIWEPTRWMESIFDRAADQSYHTNALIDLYPQMASDYGL